jgi:hypothetical protein
MVLWHLRYKLAQRDLQEMSLIRGILCSAMIELLSRSMAAWDAKRGLISVDGSLSHGVEQSADSPQGTE